jgi:hypothetical protein
MHKERGIILKRECLKYNKYNRAEKRHGATKEKRT